MISRTDVDRDGVIAPYERKPFRILDPTSETAVAPATARLDWIGSVSAGYKKKETRNGKEIEYPVVSRDGTIYMSEDDQRTAPGLAAALAARGGKSLGIAFTTHNLEEIVLQRLVAYTAGSVRVFGDENALTEVTLNVGPNGKDAPATFTKYPIGSEDYARCLALCKAETHVLFILVEWVDGVMKYAFPDGWPNRYSIRFTGRHSARAIIGKLESILDGTQGRLAGLPFELKLDYRDVLGGDGKRHRIPVWALNFDPPGEVKLSFEQLRNFTAMSLDRGRQLRALPAPKYEIEQALLEAPIDAEDVSLSDDAVNAIVNDPPCDEAHYRAAFFAAVRGSQLAADDDRADLVGEFTHKHFEDAPVRWTESLADFLQGNAGEQIPPATESEASALIAFVAERVVAARLAQTAEHVHEPAPPASESIASNPPTEPRIPAGELEHVGPENAGELAGSGGNSDKNISSATTSSGGKEDRPDADSPQPPATDTTPAPKSKARLTAEQNFATLMTAARDLPAIDLAEYEIDADVSDAKLTSLLGKLAAAVRTAATKPAGART